MKFRSMPAVVTLLAGLIVSVIMFIRNVPLQTFLITLFLVLLVFSVFSLCFRALLVKLWSFTVEKEEKEETNEEKQEEENSNSEQENK